MKATACALLLLPVLQYFPQEEDKWKRLYTYEDSAVDIETSNIIFSSDFTGRVRFRITLSKPQTLGGGADVKYKSVIETMEFKCPERRYRVVAVKRFDGKGNMVQSSEAEPPPEWKTAGLGSMMGKFMEAGCEAIYEKKRNP
ncbi:MAG TPA: surface-adhesin E family protein [Blastocatellia bacterium]